MVFIFIYRTTEYKHQSSDLLIVFSTIKRNLAFRFMNRTCRTRALFRTHPEHPDMDQSNPSLHLQVMTSSALSSSYMKGSHLEDADSAHLTCTHTHLRTLLLTHTHTHTHDTILVPHSSVQRCSKGFGFKSRLVASLMHTYYTDKHTQTHTHTCIHIHTHTHTED